MDQIQKNKFLSTAREHAGGIIKKIYDSRVALQDSIYRMMRDARSLSRADQISTEGVAVQLTMRTQELEVLEKSPYFVKCEIQSKEYGKRTYYFSKFHFSDEHIYSWVAPAAMLRFENPGNVSYNVHEKTHHCELLRKDNFMIVEGEITFFSTESINQPRELIYQKDFTTRKQGFILPEIVEQMEKAQDQVIRADHKGPFVISGPAGSGKTTLALHRIAYLTLSPDTARLFPSSHIVVFVQDSGSKEYFSKLLPELGIRDVTITTFAQWAVDICALPTMQVIRRYGTSEEQKDFYEYEKIQALRNTIPQYAVSPYKVLEAVYKESLSKSSYKLFEQQKKEHVLDHIDLTLLLQAHADYFKGISLQQEYYVQQKNGVVKKKIGRLPVTHPLMLIDEFQNYLPEQLELFKKCLSAKWQGLLYVGDSAQQIYIGTIQNIGQSEGQLLPERSVILQKVYRNTKKILSYIQSLGYTVVIPENMKEGVGVSEIHCKTPLEEIVALKAFRKNNQNVTIGVLALQEEYLKPFKTEFENDTKMYMKTMYECQGLEFDIVCIVGVNPNLFTYTMLEGQEEFIKEWKKIKKDLLYVALTRAMDELHIFGSCSLKEVLHVL